jgi:hypothetical protein
MHFNSSEFLIPTIVLGLVILLLLYYIVHLIVSRRRLYITYKDVIDIDKEVSLRNRALAAIKNDIEKIQKEYDAKNSSLSAEYSQKRVIYENLLRETSILEEDLDFISYGLYKPHFDFDTSSQYMDEINNVVDKQKGMIRSKTAIICHSEWTVSGSKREGQKMTNQYMKLMLRAFNNECDAAVLKVKWDNILKMEERIRKAYEAINQLGSTHHTEITETYCKLRIDELRLAHEYQDKLHEEKEEQRRIREQMREEERVQQEIEKAKRDAEDEEKRFQKALDKAKKELEGTHGDEALKLNDQIAQLQQQLTEALEKKERALSRAQLTKSGHVYVISNIGSFGEKVFKIGMTRRLEPLDRVRELGDASVPFEYDVHAMIYSENAPELEYQLQKNFESNRVNLVNGRKEFFSVELMEIEKLVLENKADIKFTRIAEAREFRESNAIREEARLKGQMKKELVEKFPLTI